MTIQQVRLMGMRLVRAFQKMYPNAEVKMRTGRNAANDVHIRIVHDACAEADFETAVKTAYKGLQPTSYKMHRFESFTRKMASGANEKGAYYFINF